MQALQYTSAIAILWRLREAHLGFKTILSHIARCCPSNEKKMKHKSTLA
jgi:hypothetical protein